MNDLKPRLWQCDECKKFLFLHTDLDHIQSSASKHSKTCGDESVCANVSYYTQVNNEYKWEGVVAVLKSQLSKA